MVAVIGADVSSCSRVQAQIGWEEIELGDKIGEGGFAGM
jgi:hypothetical protein